MTADTFPVDRYRDAAPHLRRPFTPAAVKFKVQATWNSGGLIVAYIDARLAVERLNLVCPHLWWDAYEAANNGLMWCHLTVDGITRSDVGEGQKKGLVSDALKRAAVKFGIGVSLYATPSLMLNVSDGHLKQKRDDKLELTDNGAKHCRGLYAKWLKDHGAQAFGDPLDHGDVEGATGDAEADTPTTRRTEPLRQPISEEQREKVKTALAETGLVAADQFALLEKAGFKSVEDLRILDDAYKVKAVMVEAGFE